MGWVVREFKKKAFGPSFLLALVGPWGVWAQDALQVASPDWSREVIYFAMIDRFANGDASRDDLGRGEWDPTRESHYHGGDLKGLVGGLDYIQALGATAVWITPPVANQWWNPQRSYTGYHGYWAEHFSEVDAHYGTLADLQDFSRAVHRRGMHWIQDVVVNHTGDYLVPRQAGDSVVWQVTGAPRQAPFDQNDPGNPEHRVAGVYHWTPDLVDYTDPEQLQKRALAGLDDLCTERQLVRDSLRAIYGRWIREAGADGFRFDTQMYVEPGFWDDFLDSEDLGVPGVERVAASLGKSDFLTFGEIWVGSAPRGREGEDRIAEYLVRPGDRGVDGALNFPLQGTLRRVFLEGAPVGELTHRLRAQAQGPAGSIGRERFWLNFLDNHDMPRFRRDASEAAYRAAMRTLLVLPGIPVIYQGTEQGDVETRANLFGRLDGGSSAYRWLQEALRWRAGCGPCGRGEWEVWEPVEAAVDGLWVGRTVWEGDTLWVAVNPSEVRWVGVGVEGTVPWGWGRAVAEVEEGGAARLVWDGATLVHGDLPPWGWVAWRRWDRVGGTGAGAPLEGTWEVVTNRGEPMAVGGTLRCEPGDALVFRTDASPSEALVLDGGRVIQEGSWRLACGALAAGPHRLVAMESGSAGRERAANPVAVDLIWDRKHLASVEDPCGDDRGLDGRLLPPTDATFAGQTDIKSLHIFQEGNDCIVELTVCRPVTALWNPRWGFDHVAWFLWLGQRTEVAGTGAAPAEVGGQKPEDGGQLPEVGGLMPEGFRWDLRVRHSGWTLSTVGADGVPREAPGFELDRDAGRYRWRIPMTGGTEGSRCLYVTSWDAEGEGALRPLRPEPGPYHFGGSPGTPSIADACFVIF